MADDSGQPEQPDFEETSNSSDEMTDYLQVYLDESDDELEALVQALLTLESDPRNHEALDEAFRLLHTLKGSAGMMGFEGISELAHALENRFESYRSGEETLDQMTMDILLQGVDFFREFHAGLRRGEQPSQDAGDLIARLTALEDGGAAAADVPQPVEPAASDLSRRSADTLALEGAYRVRVQFQPGLQLADLKARLIVARLSQVGEIVATDPPIDEIRSVDDLPGFAVIVLCHEDPERVREIADVDGVVGVEIEGSSLSGLAGQGEEAEAAFEPDPLTDPPVESDTGTADAEPLGEMSAIDISDKGEPLESVVDQAEALATPSDVRSGPDRDSEAAPGSDAHQREGSPGDGGRSRRASVSVTETVRVNIDRLDQLMNLTGELVVTRARLTEIAGGMRSVFRNRATSRMSRNIGERLRSRLDALRKLKDRQTRDAAEWDQLLMNLEADIVSLENQTADWEEGRRRYGQFEETVEQLNRVSDSLQKGILKTRMVQVAPLFNRFRRVIRDLSGDRNKLVQLTIRGENTELDKRMIDELGDPLIHLVRNSIDHGLERPEERRRAGKPETGTILLEAFHSGNNVFIRISDDGAGIDTQRIRRRLTERDNVSEDIVRQLSDQQVVEHIWSPGFSTAEKVTDVSGRGVGMDVVRRRIADLGGTIEVETAPGQGTSFTIRLPLTLAIIRSLLVRYRDGVFSIPIDDVQEIVSVPADEVFRIHDYRTIDVRGEFIPVTGMGEVFDWNQGQNEVGGAEALPAEEPSTMINVVILRNGETRIGLCVDELLGGCDSVIKSLADNFVDIRGLSGASVMGDGTVCLMLDAKAVAVLAAERAQWQHSRGTLMR